jgi:hypothetical protein
VEGDIGNAAGLGGGAPVRAIWRSSIGTKHSASAGLPESSRWKANSS